MIGGILLLPTVSNAKPFDACRTSTNAVYDSCIAAAKSDRAVAVGKCDNLSGLGAVKACRAQAAADAKDARDTCAAGRKVRVGACSKLGATPYQPTINPANFVATIDNPFFPLVPGTTFVYEGQTPDGLEHDEFAVTHTTRVILDVTCTEVHDTVTTNGVLTEDTLDWFAQDKTGNVWYFGENTHELVDGLISTIDGTFMGGVDGAQPGIVMEAHPAIGDFYRQEFDLGNAEDFAEVVGLSASVTVPFGSFTNCLDTRETTPLEPDLHEHKFYAAGVGNVLETDEDTGARTELIEVKTGQ
ncbi:MAG TPA: hypothetical protein VJ829_16750 [Candidatus Binatia bacterium]|nr:hypothetical protein [Candidatus Binatia bacterium]